MFHILISRPARPDGIPPVNVLACQFDDASYFNVPPGPARLDPPVRVRRCRRRRRASPTHQKPE
eukprot:5866325-Pyramimonas_sp.AAC.1